MPDQVVLDELPDEVTMRVFERAVTLENGATVWLRRFTLNPDGTRRELADGRWCALRGGVADMYAVPMGDVHGGTEWQYKYPYSYPTWAQALAAAIVAERADERARARKGRGR